MRGLTSAERATLDFMINGPGPGLAIDFRSDAEQETVEAMHAQGRISTFTQEDSEGEWLVFTPTPLGRLALRLWPATSATPGAEGR